MKRDLAPARAASTGPDSLACEGGRNGRDVPVRCLPEPSSKTRLLRALSGESHMLDQNVVSVMESKAKHDLDDRRAVFEREMAQIKEEMVALGTLCSGGTVRRILNAMEAEYRIRAQLIWQAFARAFTAAAVTPAAELLSEAKTRLARILDEKSNDMLKYHADLKGIMRGGTPPKTLETLRQSALDRANTEIDYLGIVSSRQTTPSSDTSNNVFYQCSGIFQTGSGSIILSAIGAEERHAIAEAIEASKRALAADGTVDAKQRNEASELLSDLEAEMERPEPNSQRIRAALWGLAMTVQTLAATPQAYQLVKGAAALFGLALP